MIFLQESLWFTARWKTRNGILLRATGAIVPDGSGLLNATRQDGGTTEGAEAEPPVCYSNLKNKALNETGSPVVVV